MAPTTFSPRGPARILLLSLAAAAAAPAPAAAAAGHGGIEWFDGPFAAARAKAEAKGKRLLVYFWNEGSRHCARLYRETLTHAEGVAAVAGFVCYSAKISEPEGEKLLRRYHVERLPTILILAPDGSVDDGVIGYIPRADFVSEMRRIGRRADTVGDLRSRIAAAPDDLELRHRLALKLKELGDARGHDRLIDEIKAADPEARTLTGADVAWRECIRSIFAATDDPKEADLEPMYEFLARCEHDRIRFLGWDWVARVEHAKGERARMRAAIARAWEHVPEDRVMDWGRDTAMKAFGMRDELSAAERRLALEMARKALARAERHESGDADRARLVAGHLEAVACCYAMTGRKDEAVRALKRCLELVPDSERYRERLAELEGEGERGG